jgi:hypothetical protein
MVKTLGIPIKSRPNFQLQSRPGPDLGENFNPDPGRDIPIPTRDPDPGQDIPIPTRDPDPVLEHCFQRLKYKIIIPQYSNPTHYRHVGTVDDLG